MNEHDASILKEILDYCEKIESRKVEFNIDENSFVENSALFDMLLMPLFQIGELAKSLSDEYADACKAVPWHAVRGFRNIIAHDYGVVDPLWAWNTVEVDIPALRKYLESELN